MAPAPLHPPRRSWRALVERALEEDVGAGDVTSALVLPAGARATGVLEARAPLVVCGIEVAAAVFEAVDPAVAFAPARADGDRAGAGEPLAHVSGPVHGLLAAERTALNFLARLSGVASATRRFVERVAGTGARIVDTRKTLPGWRVLEKYAVTVGGGEPHRMGLYDAVLVKDNHAAAAGGVGPAVKAARAAAPAHLWIQAEVESAAEAEAALAAGADSLLLDNRRLEELRELARRFGERTLLEASGGITLETVRAVAETGVHRISVGALTQDAASADVALELAPPEGRRA